MTRFSFLEWFTACSLAVAWIIYGREGFYSVIAIVIVALLWEISDRLRTHTDELRSLVRLAYMQAPKEKQEEYADWLPGRVKK